MRQLSLSQPAFALVGLQLADQRSRNLFEVTPVYVTERLPRTVTVGKEGIGGVQAGTRRSAAVVVNRRSVCIMYVS